VSGSLRGDEPNFSEAPEFDGVSQEYVTARYIFGYGPPTLISARLAVALMKLVWKADLVFVSFGREAVPVLAATLAKLLRKPLILQTHGMLEPRDSRLHRVADALLVRRLYLSADERIALTMREAESLVKFSRRHIKVEVLGNPVLATAEKEATTPEGIYTEDPGEALFLGRLHERKRVQDFARAAKYADALGMAGKYRIVGPDQGELQKIKQYVDVLNGRLVYEGAISGRDVVGRLRQCSVFVLPSRDEPWGNVLVAAVALGKPVVMTASAALAVDLRRAGCARVVADGDVEGIANAVHEILTDEKCRSEMRFAAWRYAQRELGNDALTERLRRVVMAVRSRGDDKYIDGSRSAHE
jgi:glycosyltransferase involved in cell wall biosynthesis